MTSGAHGCLGRDAGPEEVEEGLTLSEVDHAATNSPIHPVATAPGMEPFQLLKSSARQ